MATRTSKVRVALESSGGNKVAGDLNKVGKSTEQVGRQQTRLGQASASAGRQFSAQASGLGGLVAAYAGAAATVFALQAAFDALARSARAETIIQGTKTLALEIGQSGPRILKQITEITQGQIELSEAAQNINIALSAGFNTDQISRLTKVSLGASRALGRNLTDALQRVVRGAAKLEPELLDELGIFTRIDPAVNRYAQRLGIATSNLSDFERRQAFVNAVIEEGERKFSSIDVASSSTQKSLEQLQVQIQQLAIEFGQAIAKTLLPFVNFFKNNAGNTLLLFGGILALVFGKATEIIGNFSKKSLNNLSDLAAGFADSAAKAKGSTEKIQKGIVSLQATIDKRGGLAAKGGSFTRGLTRDLSSAAADVRRRFLSGEDVDIRQRAKDVEVLKKAQTQLNAAGRGTSAAYSDATKIIRTYGKATEAAGFRARAATALSVGLQKAIRGVGIAAAFAGKALNTLFFGVAAIQIVGSFFDFDLLQSIKDAFIDNSQAAKDFEGGLKGLATAAVGGGAALSNAIKEIKEDFNFDDIDSQFKDALNTIEQARRIFTDVETVDILTGKAKTIKVQTGTRDFEATAIEEITAKQNKLNAELKKGELANQEIIDALNIQLLIFDSLLQAQQKFGLENRQLAGQLSRLTGLPLDRVPATFTDAALGVQRLGDGLKIAGIEIKKVGDQFTLQGLTDKQREAIESNTIFNDTLAQTTEAFERGALNSEKLGARLAGLESSLATVKKEGKLAADEIKRFEEEVEGVRADLLELKTLETITKGISKTFSGALGAIDTAVFKGLVDSTGAFAENSEAAARNQVAFLQATIQNNVAEAVLVDKKAEGDELDATIYERAQNYNLALKASAGLLFQNFQTAQKIVKQEELKSIQLGNQKEKLAEQLDILQQQGALAVRERNLRTENEAFSRTNKFKEDELSLQKAIVDASKENAIAASKIAQLENARLTTQREIATIQKQSTIDTVRAERARAKTRLEADIEVAQDDPRSTEKEIRVLRRELIELERQNAIATFNENKELANDSYARELALISERKTILNKELTGITVSLIQQRLLQAKETQNLTFRQKTALKQLQDEKELLNTRLAIQQGILSNEIKDVDRREDLFETQNKAAQAQIKTMGIFIDGVNALNEGTFVQAIKQYLIEQGAEGFSEDTFAKQLIKDARNKFEEASGLLDGNAQAQRDIFEAERTNIKQKKINALTLFMAESKAANGKIRDTKLIQKLEQDQLAQEQKRRIQALNNEADIIREKLKNEDKLGQKAFESLTAQLATLEAQKQAALLTLNIRVEALDKEADVLEQLRMSASSIVESGVTDAMMSLNDALIEGTFTMADLERGFRNMLRSMLREIQSAVFARTIANPIADFVGGLFSAGGKVHLAAGGTMKRDRVSALLEPGEFVIRKEAAKKLGMSKLMELNSGISDDPLARLVAYMGGSKVRKRAGGGDIRNESAFSGGASFGAAEAGSAAVSASINSSNSSYFSDFGGGNGGGNGGGQTIPALSMAEKQARDPVGFAQAELTRARIQKQLDMGNDVTQSDALSIFQSPGVAARAVAQSRFQNPSRAGAGLLLSQTSLGPIGAAMGLGSALGDFFRAMGADVEDDRMKAAGGPIHMAGGGAVKSRDRVPALLEPGEFVIRRPMAKAIGGAALNQMNATGRPPQVSVNMTNQGAPKDVTVAQPKMNGDKIILDIITRDLRNNGAIKKSLRKNR